MKPLRFNVTVFLCIFVLLGLCRNAIAAADSSAKSRLIILADMGNEPDEEQQMLHMIMCSNEFELEGLIAVTGKYLRPESKEAYRQKLHPELFINIIDAYAKVYNNLKIHAAGWHDPEYLRSIVKAGQTGYGIADTGQGKSSPGSELIIKAVTKDDPRPIWVVVNAGSNTLAQSLKDYQANHSQEQVDAFIAKLRVFENGAQDNAGAWICSQFPLIHWIRSNYQTYAYGGPGGKDGNVDSNLGPYYWQPYPQTTVGQHEWLKENVQKDHGAMGQLYPDRKLGSKVAFMEGGGTVPWLGLVNKGLFDVDHPSWGGWSGRFTAKKVPDFWSRHLDIKADELSVSPFYTYREASDVWTDPATGTVYYNDYVPVWRWRPAMYNDFKCRMDWCVKPYDQANHHPVAAYNGDKSDRIIRLKALAGQEIALDASASSDPDKDELSYAWWVYEEAGTYPGRVMIENADKPKAKAYIPTGAGGTQIHIILEIRDNNKIASLYDYRRIVADIDDIVVTLEPIQIH